jgi:hypothetical protein
VQPVLKLNGGVFRRVRIIAKSDCLSLRLSVCLSAWNNWTPTEGIFMESDVLVFFENLFRKFKFY